MTYIGMAEATVALVGGELGTHATSGRLHGHAGPRISAIQLLSRLSWSDVRQPSGLTVTGSRGVTPLMRRSAITGFQIAAIVQGRRAKACAGDLATR